METQFKYINDQNINMIEGALAGDKIRVTLILKKDVNEYKIVNQTFQIISNGGRKSEEFKLPSTNGGSKSDAYEQSSLVPSQLQRQLLKGGKRRFSNSNRMNIRRVYNRTMSRRD